MRRLLSTIVIAGLAVPAIAQTDAAFTYQGSLSVHQIHPAFAYGFVNRSGSIRNASANVTGVQRTSTGNYLIHVDGGARSGDAAIATIADTFSIIGVRVQGSAYSVYVRGSSSTDPIDAEFQFVVYRP